MRTLKLQGSGAFAQGRSPVINGAHALWGGTKVAPGPAVGVGIWCLLVLLCEWVELLCLSTGTPFFHSSGHSLVEPRGKLSGK